MLKQKSLDINLTVKVGQVNNGNQPVTLYQVETLVPFSISMEVSDANLRNTVKANPIFAETDVYGKAL